LHASQSWHGIGNLETLYHAVEEIRELSEPWKFPTSDGDDTRIARMFLRLDDTMQFTDVVYYNILDLLSETGGLFDALMTLGFWLTAYFAGDLFNMIVLSKLFRQKTDEPC